MRVGASGTHAPCPSDILMLLIIKVHSLVSGPPHVSSTSQIGSLVLQASEDGLYF